MYWNESMECATLNEMRALQSFRLSQTVRRVYERVPLYRKRMDEAGVSPADIRSVDDLHKLPFTYKKDLRDTYPYGLFAVPMKDVVRLHASSGTTGKQIVVGYTREDLDIWEGLFKAAESYADWTDAQTPDIPGDAKSMFVHDYYFNYFQVGAESLGEDFFRGDELAFGPAFQTAWEPLAQAALRGGVWLKGGYATESIRTGDSIVSVASSASILYYSDVVTYPDNTSEEITIISRPCPVFENGEKLVMQRGAGFCTVRSTPEREQAAVTFLKWLTEPDHNVEFVTRTGYMPVTRAAFENELPKAIEGLESAKYASLYQAYLDTQANYEFYVPPQLESYLSLETTLEDQVRSQLALGRQDYLGAGETGLKQISAERLQAFREIMER